ncbi:lantibiotic dehydratase [Streptomyces sp. NPDC005811]|uniref:lantibiotic dehydratase n=1 Tax=Streptomyces sp. NPDC005811 TaxID=3154565 RepID=UPI00340E70A7
MTGHDGRSPEDHLVPLGTTGWHLWRDVVLRSAGFPADRVLALTDPALAAAADLRNATGAKPGAPEHETYLAAFDEAAGRLSAAVRATAREPLFREAVTWQNRKLVADCLNKAAAGEPRNVRGRNHEATITSYVQRYSLKNDTIGFFGPVGWGEWKPSAVTGLEVHHGPGLLARRTVYFESWAIDSVARTLSEDPRMLPWLAPRTVPSDRLGGQLLHRPGKPPLGLSEEEAEVVGLCDGVRTAREIAQELLWSGLPGLESEPEVFAVLGSLRDRGLLVIDLTGPIEAFPEQTLAKKLELVGDLDLRTSALATLKRLVDARDTIANAAGDCEALAAAMDGLNAAFEEITGGSSVRRAGATYAGRTLVYEDTVRDVRAGLGKPLLDELAPPLGLMLDSARWLVNRIADGYGALFAGFHDRWSQRTGDPAMPLHNMVSMATPHLFFSIRQLPGPVKSAIADFQERWARILRIPDGARHHQVTVAEIADRVREEFPAAPVPWATAVHHAPDLMIAAADIDAVSRGEYQWVLGELHTAFNSLESRLFVEQHDVPASLLAADSADHGSRRIYLVPPKDWPAVTSRLAPPSTLLAPAYTYWSLRDGAVRAPGRMLALADLFVHQEEGQLVVRSRSEAFSASLTEMMGELLSAASVNAFKPLASAPHRPRVSVGRMVVSRESWSFRAADLAWANVKSEPDRFRAARAWRAEQGLPERVFYKSPAEDKPAFADFGSIALVNMLAKIIRKTAEDPEAGIGLTEMLPDLGETWLQDRTGAWFTAELRTVAVDTHGYPSRQEN